MGYHGYVVEKDRMQITITTLFSIVNVAKMEPFTVALNLLIYKIKTRQHAII